MGELNIHFRAQCVIMTLRVGEEGGPVIANDVLKMEKVIKFQSS